MTDEQRKRIHDITYSTADRAELAERIVVLEDENAKLREALAYAFKAECANKPTECKTCKEQCPFSRIGVLMDELGIIDSD